jgi:hypothetical protein
VGHLAFNALQAVVEQLNQIIRQASTSGVLIRMDADEVATWERWG